MNLKKLLGSILGLLLVFFLHSSVSAQQGCCSWHGGIDYCDSSAGRYVCNDGTYSPSCGCYVEESLPQITPDTSVFDDFDEWEKSLTPTPTETPFPTPTLTFVQFATNGQESGSIPVIPSIVLLVATSVISYVIGASNKS